MGNRISKQKVTFTSIDIPTKPVLNFCEKPFNVSGSNVDDALTIFNFISDVISISKYAEIPKKILDNKEYGDKILAFLGNSDQLVNFLNSSQVQKNDCLKVACEIKAKIVAIKEIREYMLDEKILVKDKHTHVGLAIHTFREVLSLFQNKNYTLWKVPVPASVLLIDFASIFAENALLSGAILPSYKDRLYSSMELLKQTLCSYKEHCISTRISLFTCQARTYHRCVSRFSYGDWVYDDEYLSKYSNKHQGPQSGIHFHLGDKWPSVWKNGQLECWYWEPSDENIKTAISRGLLYRKQMKLLYSEYFDKGKKGIMLPYVLTEDFVFLAINGVNDTAKKLMK